MERADEQGGAFRIDELGEDHGKSLPAEHAHQLLQPRHDVARRRHFHRLARIEEGPLHVDHEQRRAAGDQREGLLERGAPVSHRLDLRLPIGSLATTAQR